MRFQKWEKVPLPLPEREGDVVREGLSAWVYENEKARQGEGRKNRTEGAVCAAPQGSFKK